MCFAALGRTGEICQTVRPGLKPAKVLVLAVVIHTHFTLTSFGVVTAPLIFWAGGARPRCFCLFLDKDTPLVQLGAACWRGRCKRNTTSCLIGLHDSGTRICMTW
jgi:hypothetical protein